MLLDSKTGNVIAADTMPDRKESYMTPLCFSQPGSKEIFILFGTGGETIDGNLYMASMSQFLSKKLSEGKDNCHQKKVMVSLHRPHWRILIKTGILDIIAISHGSKAVAIDGKDYHVLWTKSFPGTECSNSFAAGLFYR